VLDVPKNVTVLIVDDDRAIQRLLADFLTKEGFSVLVEKDGEWALKTFEKRPVRVVLLDILLPAVNGYEVARKIRQTTKGREMPLIFISGVYRAPGQKKDAIEKYQALDFLEKPIKLSALRAILKKALGAEYPSAAEAQAERERVEATDPGVYADRQAAEEAQVVEQESQRQTAELDAAAAAAAVAAVSTRSAKRTSQSAERPQPPPPPAYSDEPEPPTQVRPPDAPPPGGNDRTEQLERPSSHEAKTDGLRGQLSDRPFAELLAEVYRHRQSGALLLKREKVKKIVYFRSGQPYFVKSNLLSECLGKILVREKMISEAECEESLKRMKSSSRQQGTVLIEMGCISPPNLAYALALQLQSKLFDIFSWPDGEYQFNAKAELLPEATSLEMTCAAAIYEGIKRTQDLDHISALMKPQQGKYVHPAADPLYRFQDAGLDEEELSLLGACDGRKTVKTLAALAILPPIETMRLLLAMRYAQMVDFKDEAAPAPERHFPSRVASVPWDDNTEGATQRATPVPPDGADETQVDVPAYKPSASASAASEPAAPAGAPTSRTRANSSGGAAKPARTSGGVKPRETPSAMNRPNSTPSVQLPPPPPAPSGPPPLPPPLPKRPNSLSGAPPPSAEESKPVVARAAGSLLPELSGLISIGVSAEERALRERLAGIVMSFKKQDYFQTLGVPPTASLEELKQAYLALAKEYHPDRHFRSASAEVRNLANELYQLITTAYETLKDPTEREKYVADMAKGIKRESGDQVSKILAAEGKFQRGEELLRKKQFREAHSAFKEAVALYGDEGEFHAFLGWSLFQTDPRSGDVAQQALDMLEQAIRLNPKVDKSYLFLGYIYKATGRPDKAERQFEKAIQCNPDCTEALLELRLLGRR
jgi:DNA-binding response OmpR family regulator/DnaJ-domain-containing protein 1